MHLTLTKKLENDGWLARGLTTAVDWVMHGVGAVAAFLVVAETVILLCGVIFRYGLDQPLIWSDELASILFSWLAMLGAVLALHRGAHMRLTAIVTRLPEKWRGWLEAVSALTVCTFVALIITPAIEHMNLQMPVSTPALQLPDGWRCAALPVGAALMLLAALARIAREVSPVQFAGALLTAGAIAAALWIAQPYLLALGNLNLIVFFVVLVGLCVAGGVPIAFSFGTATLAYLVLMTHAPLGIVVSRMDEGMANLVLLSVPLFVLLGALLELSGLARCLIDFMAALLGHVRGGLQYVLLGAMFLVSGISGAKAADMAAIAPALFPEMQRRGAKPEELVALLSSTGAMTETIPPSLVLITIGAVCGVSITALFVGGIMPAVVATIAIGFVCWRRARHEPASNSTRAPLRTILRTFVIALPALALPMLIRVVVIEGAATATEVSTIGIAYTLIAGVLLHLCGRRIEWRRLYSLLLDTASLSGAILLIIGLATAMAWALTQSGFSASLVAAMEQIPGGPRAFLCVSIVLFVVLGSVLEGIPAIVLFGPLLFPVARALGIHDVHYAMVVILSMGLGLFAPPMGVGFYAACAIGKVSPDRVVSRVWGYLGALFIALLVVAFVPWLSIGFLK
ncbi:TRAP transporter large permease subunit [Paraburkholderia fungorum]|jgi:tripartite ATP-independent transporter DctM subunit|uniref:TRAP transporter large permease subunit n=1 Tax=Paraburkholderia fungorum TaxID=134537 RepID=A0AAP5QAS2_9BURK|nr:TRAP transporter large permease subunit [Paraburkholderia fungorum]MDT8838787.1 TRAP transporter large permease subunit [Paraburkholderia fungorum]PRZ47444.1 tripartite ATP-independent transporter DctM subunit [Paraburkholderia fungorum]